MENKENVIQVDFTKKDINPIQDDKDVDLTLRLANIRASIGRINELLERLHND